MKAYHFLKDDMSAGSGSEPAWKEGETREIKGLIATCSRGYHSSSTWYDALNYAPGNIACIVDIPTIREGTIKDTDKCVSPKRTLIAARDAGKVLRYWACDCAERALKRVNVTDERSWNAIKVARAYNEGKATKQDLDASWAASRAASWDASLAASRAASWAASLAASRAATLDASWAASWDVEIKWQKRRLNWYMKKLFNDEL